MQIAQLTKATLDVCHVDLHIILEAARNTEKTTVQEMLSTSRLTGSDTDLDNNKKEHV